MLKKTFSLLLAAAMTFALAACGTTASYNKVDNTLSADEEAIIEEYSESFEELTYEDSETDLSITYNLFLPEGYDESKEYPAVFFIADASCTGDDPSESLTQGLGALVWATDEWQSAYECIVVVPTYPETIIDDRDGHSTTEYVEMTKRLIDQLSEEYAVDTDRIYGTGQSMGCMTTMLLAAQYPDLYAACMLVDGQWQTEDLKGLENQTFVYFAAEEDMKAHDGVTEVVAMFNEDEVSYSKAQWDGNWTADELTAAGEELFAKGTDANFITWKEGTIGSEGEHVHMASFDYAYNCTYVMEWLFNQTK